MNAKLREELMDESNPYNLRNKRIYNINLNALGKSYKYNEIRLDFMNMFPDIIFSIPPNYSFDKHNRNYRIEDKLPSAILDWKIIDVRAPYVSSEDIKLKIDTPFPFLGHDRGIRDSFSYGINRDIDTTAYSPIVRNIPIFGDFEYRQTLFPFNPARDTVDNALYLFREVQTGENYYVVSNNKAYAADYSINYQYDFYPSKALDVREGLAGLFQNLFIDNIPDLIIRYSDDYYDSFAAFTTEHLRIVGYDTWEVTYNSRDYVVSSSVWKHSQMSRTELWNIVNACGGLMIAGKDKLDSNEKSTTCQAVINEKGINQLKEFRDKLNYDIKFRRVNE